MNKESTLEEIKKSAEKVVGRWDEENAGIKEKRTTIIALEIIDAVDRIEELQKELEPQEEEPLELPELKGTMEQLNKLTIFPPKE